MGASGHPRLGGAADAEGVAADGRRREGPTGREQLGLRAEGKGGWGSGRRGRAAGAGRAAGLAFVPEAAQAMAEQLKEAAVANKETTKAHR